MMRQEKEKPWAKEKKMDKIGWVVVLFGLFFGGVMVWYGGIQMLRWWYAEDLVPGEAVLHDLYIEQSSSPGAGEQNNLSPNRRKGVFVRHVHGKNYYSRGLDLYKMPDDLREGDTVTVYYNPHHPEKMYLTKDLPLFGPVILFLAGLVLVVSFSLGVSLSVKI